MLQYVNREVSFEALISLRGCPVVLHTFKHLNLAVISPGRSYMYWTLIRLIRGVKQQLYRSIASLYSLSLSECVELNGKPVVHRCPLNISAKTIDSGINRGVSFITDNSPRTAARETTSPLKL